jgi:HPt (histidine-containing phosphotransfer) domain-containing protein
MAVIDWDQFNENFQYYDRDTIVEVIENFFEEFEGRLEMLGKNIAESDLKQLSFNAHSLKSVIGNFMAPAPYEICRKIEELAKQNSKELIPDLNAELKILVYELNSDLREYLQKQQ